MPHKHSKQLIDVAFPHTAHQTLTPQKLGNIWEYDEQKQTLFISRQKKGGPKSQCPFKLKMSKDKNDNIEQYSISLINKGQAILHIPNALFRFNNMLRHSLLKKK